MAPFLIGIVAAVVIALIVVGAMQAVRRRKELAAWAAGHGFSFDQFRDGHFQDAYPQFKQFDRGERNRYANNVMRGKHGDHRVVCFDYHYETTSTDSKGHRTTHSHEFSGLIIAPPHGLRPLFIRPEHFFDKIGEFFGLDDIDFESAQFSRKFMVKSSDRRWAFDVITQETMEFMLSHQRYTMQMDDAHLLLLNDKTWRAADFEQALEYAEHFLALIPPGVVDDLHAGERAIDTER
ncbi:MAG: hypothetical protein IT445_02760 [Phycisphaeraceae bacterium]|nr:hypothetical protein [Phycisphaeraceae bacterium]